MRGHDEPVKNGITTMKTRVSLIKLRHQADMLGLDFNCETSWIFKHKDRLLIKNASTDGSDGGNCVESYGSVADLLPDNPSDWLPFDKMLANPLIQEGCISIQSMRAIILIQLQTAPCLLSVVGCAKMS